MLKLKNNLNNEILKYFLIFSVVILGMLWIFQFLFFNSFYRTQKTNDIKAVALKIQKYQNKNNFEEIVNNLAFDKSVCIEMSDKNYDLLYSSTYFGKGCVSSKESTNNYKFDFINSNKDDSYFEITNPKYNNETLVYALKLENDKYVFINTSIEPVDGTIALLRKELIVISLLLLALSIVLAYFISNYIASPIKKINNEAKKLAKGDFNIEFKNDSKILEINELSETLNYAKDELNKTEEYRRDLMANVSHDLKTPLTMIKAYAEIAKDLHQNNKEKQEEDMDTIIKETDRLTILVNDILVLSKMQSNIEKLDITEFDLIELIDEILKRYSLYQETENYKFIFNHKNITKVNIKADKVKIEQVIYNLINNAINYTGEDNTVIINVSKLKNKKLKVEIIDSGKGIKEEDLPYIWDKYYKNKKKHKRNLIGTGLGLSIVKNIFELHKYEYGVISNKDKGTCFYFIIEKEN
jgi:signal transduction histidine kinase